MSLEQSRNHADGARRDSGGTQMRGGSGSAREEAMVDGDLDDPLVRVAPRRRMK